MSDVDGSAESPGSGLFESVDAARDCPRNTCGASRHAQMIGEAMMDGLLPPDDEAIRNAGESILATVKALYEARTRIKEQDELLCRIAMESFAENG